MRSLRVQLIAVLTAVAVLLPGGALGRTRFFCHMMNRVVATCCCDGDSKEDGASSCEVRVRSTDCCERLSAAARTPTLKALGTENISVPAAAVTAAVLTPVYVFPRTIASVSLPRQARAPPIVGPPLFLAKCSLLT
jgi:hypothetical protein